MNRRSFFGLAVGVLVAPLLPVEAQAACNPEAWDGPEFDWGTSMKYPRVINPIEARGYLTPPLPECAYGVPQWVIEMSQKASRDHRSAVAKLKETTHA